MNQSQRNIRIECQQLAQLIVVFLVMLVCSQSVQAQFNSSQQNYPKWSAFTDVVVLEKGADGRPRVDVEFEGSVYRLISFHGISTEKIFDFTDKTIKRNAEHRISEDLPQIIRLMGYPIDKDTTIEIEDGQGEVRHVEVKMTGENRKAIFKKRMERGQKGLPRLIPKSRPPVNLDAEQMENDLKAFQTQLEKQFAYLHANDVDLEKAVNQIRAKHPDGIALSQLSDELRKVMALFIDGHSRVRGPKKRTANNLPFLIEPIGDRYVAFHADRTRLFNKEYPFITKIDGVEIEKLGSKFDSTIQQVSSQNLTRQRLRELRDIGRARQLAGLPDSPTLNLEFANEANETKTETAPLGKRDPAYGTWPRVPKTGASQILTQHNLGYLRLDRMNNEAVEEIKNWMPKFKSTDGLIVDVRDNAGGIRLPMIELAGYLMTAEDDPRIGNVCKYRLYKEFKSDHLSKRRYVYRKESKQFDKRDRKSITDFMEKFQPQWTPPKDDFSDWHFCVFSKKKNDARFDYQKPVVILMNQKCFSATDIFVGAFKGWPNVTLVGQPSGGGSARTMEFELPVSRIAINCASMASFQPDGKLYDGNGVQPDLLVQPKPGYFIDAGEDNFLIKAIELLTK